MVRLQSSPTIYRSSCAKPALYLAILLFIYNITFLAQAVVVQDGQWETVPEASIDQSSRVYARGVGYYTDNTVNLTGSPTLSTELRLVITQSNYEVNNADGLDASGAPYFDMASVDETVRVNFKATRGRFGYSAELQHFVVTEEPDSDGDGIPDSEDICPFDADNDIDGDGVCADVDVCPTDPGNDDDGDGICFADDICPADPLNDSDGDGLCAGDDICPFDGDNDIDGDGLCADVDVCPTDPGNDEDGDGICFADDICPADPNNACLQLTGFVFGNGAALNNAMVTIGVPGVQASTDASGAFDASVGPELLSSDGVDQFFPVKVQAVGFATGNAKVIYGASQQSFQVTVNLLEISSQITEEDDITQGVEIVKGGSNVGAITIPTASFPADVTQITGDITYIDPETDDLLSAPGGDLLALPEGSDPNVDDPVTLESFGMMEFDLRDQNGNPIEELGGGAEVCMRATSGLSEGDVIPLWYYDEEAGLWMEEGEGTVENRDGELLICGEVNHFSWWNYDQPISTHSCFRFNIVDEDGGNDLDGLQWYAQGSTYNGTSPQRSCTGNLNGDTFSSLTVKISDDASNPEQIRVFTKIGGSNFYLVSDNDGTYTLSQDQADGTLFDTPTVNGSCLSNSETGSCMPLDYMDASPDFILPVSTDINLPPVITAFEFDSFAVLVSETAGVTATVTDPEGLDVSLDWTISCGFDNAGDAFVSPATATGASGTVFNATFTAPSSINGPISYCLVDLTATDADGVTANAARYITVAGSFLHEFFGTVYDVDGQPLANAFVTYNNYENNECSSVGTQTDENGEYYIQVDLADCIDFFEGGYYDIGYLDVQFEYAGNTWIHSNYIDQYGELQYNQCYSDVDITSCEIDVNLPVLWTSISGTASIQDPSLTNYISFSTFQEFYGFGSTYLVSPIAIAPGESGDYGPIQVPIGRGYASVYFQDQGGNFSSSGNQVVLPSTDAALVDIGDFTVDLTANVRDAATTDPIENALVTMTSQDGSQPVQSGSTDVNGDFTGQVSVGSVSVGIQNPSSNATIVINSSAMPMMVDFFSDQQCMVTGTLYDLSGQPLPNTDLSVYSYDWGYTNFEFMDIVTDSNGQYMFMMTPGLVFLNNYFGYNQLEVSHCREEGGNPRTVRWDLLRGEDLFLDVN